MPRAERLSNRLDTLLEAVFDAPSDPFSLYWDIAAQLHRDQLAQAQKQIRKTLRQKGEIGAESAVLVACVLHLTGFPAHRILHSLSLYVPGGIRLSLFELAVSAIFLGEPPIPASLHYDLTQYTYLEKRLLVRKSIEISETLKGSLSPDILLYLYLLSLRDDLSNENVQLIALIMKNCFPALEVRTRIGGASLEEYGEIARAWKIAERRSLDLELRLGSGAERRGARAFDRDSASFFLDKYFSDEALSKMRAAAPTPPARRVPLHGVSGCSGAADAGGGAQTGTLSPSSRRETAPARTKSRGTAHREPEQELPAMTGPVGRQDAAESVGRVARTKLAGDRPAARMVSRARREPAAATEGGIRAATAATVVRGSRASRGPHAPRGKARGFSWLVIRAAPTVLAAVVTAVLLASVPAGFRTPAAGPGTTSAVPAPASAAVSSPPPPKPAPSVPSTTTYVVRPGDSLWKIFTQMRAQSADRKGWMDFLSKTQSLNGLGDPDQLQPGKVLTLSSQE